MSKNSRVFVGIVLAVVVVGILWTLLAPGPSDKEQIQTALANAIKASKEGRPGGVLDYLNDTISVNGTKYRAGREVADSIRKFKPDVSVRNTDPVISGDKATIDSDVQLSVFTRSLTIPNVTITFGKEESHKWLIFPSTEWKLEGVTAPPESIEAVATQLAF